MSDYRKIPVCLFFAIALLFAFGTSARADNAAPFNKVPTLLENQTLRLMNNLQSLGFQVSRGYFKLYTVDDCAYTYYIMHSCFANNPAAPYITFAIPPWPEEFVDAKTSSLEGPSQTGYNDIFRFDPREAIVILAKMPPPAAYFGEQTYLALREGTIDKSINNETYTAVAQDLPSLLQILFGYVPGEAPADTSSPRYISFSMLSNPINNVVIKRQSHSVFDQFRYFIITPDQVMNNIVQNALTNIGINQKDIFTESIPSNMNVGLDEASDTFNTLIRYAQPVDGGKTGTPSDTWRHVLPMAVFRVRNVQPNYVPQQYPQFNVNDLEERKGVNELDLADNLGNLLYSVSQKWNQPCADSHCSAQAGKFQDLQTAPPFIVGPQCQGAEENCLADNWDTTYQLYGPASLDNGEIYAVAGTLGTKTKNATYVGFGINYSEVLVGVANLSDKDLTGTAGRYRKQVNDTGKFFLYYFARDCSDIKSLTDGNCLEITDSIIPPGGHVSFTIRDYIVPETERGPDSTLILPSRVLQLHRPGNTTETKR